MLGYDRHWSRYWLLEGSCPEAVTSDESPDSCWVYVERCHWPPGENQQHRESPDDEEEDLPVGQLAQQAQHDGEAPQRAKRRKVQIPDDQGGAVSWGCYKTVEHVSRLINFLNSTGMFPSTCHSHVLLAGTTNSQATRPFAPLPPPQPPPPPGHMPLCTGPTRHCLACFRVLLVIWSSNCRSWNVSVTGICQSGDLCCVAT